MEAVALGVGLGLFAGILPGAFLTLVAATALERGRKQGFAVALLPLGTEIPVLLTVVLILTRTPEEALRWVGVGGGALVLYMAWRLVHDARESDSGGNEREGDPGHFLRVALVAVVSPNPWVFWLVIGGPLLLNRWREGALHGLAFAGSFLVCLVGARMGVAWAASAGGKRLEQTGRDRILIGAGGLLAVAGAVLIWQSWIGNFTEMVQAPEAIEERVP